MRALVLLLGVLAPWYSALAAPETLSFDDVRVGMRGEGRTVFEGDRIEPFAVEIIGKLAGIGPGRDLILARLEGGTLERTGVFAGMSGSPVYLDGKLIGAVAYAWGFATEPIAGITPVAEMQRVDRAGTPPNGRGTGRFEAAWRRFDRPAGWPALLRPDFSRLEAPGTARRLPLPLAWKGADPAAVERWGAPLRDAGFLPLAGGSAAGEGGGVPLAPGAPIGIQLMRGDLDMTATGTVTWIDGDRIWAFGHPLFGLGATDLPLTEARVQTILPSLMQSARFATAGPVRGALRQDRAAAIFGRLGGTAPTIPVRVEWTDDEGTERTFRFDVADDPFLTPLLLYAGLGGILGGDENAALDASLELLEGSAIALEGGATLEVDDRFSGPDAVATGAALPAVVLYLLAHNPWRPVRVAGVQLRYAYAPTGRTAAIERIELDRSRARPGERVEARVRYRPFRGPPRTLHAAFRVPADAPPGPLEVSAAGALRLARRERRDRDVAPRDLDQFVRLVNGRRRQGAVFLTARVSQPGTRLDGERLPNLPPSKAAALGSRPGGSLEPRFRRTLIDETYELPFVIEGEARTRLEVEE